MESWRELNFWSSGEYQVIEERLDDLDFERKPYNPSRSKMFRALNSCPPQAVKVLFCGQDPYPDRSLCTGLAFSVPPRIRQLPPTLKSIFDELVSDLLIAPPATGSLNKWAKQGVLLWNVIPTCLSGHSLSHDWDEWFYLNKEIIDYLNNRGIVFALLGSRARTYASLIDHEKNIVVETSHPSPRGSLSAKQPFKGSRIFSRINKGLIQLGKEPIDWRL